MFSTQSDSWVSIYNAIDFEIDDAIIWFVGAFFANFDPCSQYS